MLNDSGKHVLQTVVEIATYGFHGRLLDTLHLVAKKVEFDLDIEELVVPVLGPEQRVEPKTRALEDVTRLL